MSHASKDLFSSQSTVSSQGKLKENLKIKQELFEWGWIQCDNPKCQKWRRIPVDELQKLDDVEHWFCHMNPYPDRRDCLDPEEDYRKYDTLARRVGLKYVMSCLEVGSLVWAKMVGYCKWPAVVTRDPVDGSHFTVDLDGDPLSYHVEYLGEQHTHGWIRSAHVEPYGHRDKSTLQEPRHKKEGKYRRKLNLTAHCSSKSNRKTYKKNKIEDVVAEADRLLGMTCEGRISNCVFHYDHQKASNNKASVIEKRAKETCVEIEKTSNKCKLQKTFIGKEHKSKNNLIDRGRKERKQSNKIQDLEKGEQSKSKKEIRKIYDKCKFCDLKPTVLPRKRTHIHAQKDKASSMMTKGWCDSACNNSRRATTIASKELKPKSFEDSKRVTKPWAEKDLIETEEAFGDSIMTFSLDGSPVFFSQSQLNISSSMINKTKEEKFKIDIDMYQRNERAFEHDVKRFMMRNNLKLVSTPHWYNVPVRLFQLFLAVHERGGYQQVCKNKEWRAVFRELTDIQNVKTGNTVKSFYYRNLYPYELYIKGESYDYVLAETKQKKVKVARKKVHASKIFESNSKHDAIKDKVLGLETVQTSNKQILALDEGAGEDFTDLEIMLGELEQDYDALSHLSEQVDMSKKRMGINILYHDESPNCILSQGIQPANTPSEFGFANLPDHQALQKVPNQVSDGYGDFGSDEDDLMQEMRLMEEEIRAVEEFENFL
ncbi:hypothetical protein ACJMK2_023183 [Sinanodonta woodiana]|uniref:Uncharacterized protein n=1 Tax=Sinanodonta woodiana TaxID=1069815 RepID=A0ABD3T3K4_SINWO